MDAAMLTHQVMGALTPIPLYSNGVGATIAAKIGEEVYERGKKLYAM